jgi:hypothetical protein
VFFVIDWLGPHCSLDFPSASAASAFCFASFRFNRSRFAASFHSLALVFPLRLVCSASIRFASLRFDSFRLIRFAHQHYGEALLPQTHAAHTYTHSLWSQHCFVRADVSAYHAAGEPSANSVMRSSFNDLTFFELICDHLRLEMINRDFHVVIFMT